MENNIKVALIEHRTGLLDQIPESLNQSELGFAYDANRLFIGNPKNEELSIRTTFPFQNVEILTEFSDLHNFIKYRYVNNFDQIGDETSREELAERVPFAISCDPYNVPDRDMTITINGTEFTILTGMTISEFAEMVNEKYSDTKTSVFVNSKNQTSLIFVCTDNILEISADDDVIDLLGLPTDFNELADELPERRLTEKLDDTVHITDYGIKPSSNTDVSESIMKACAGLYNKFEDNQTHRCLFFPAGNYEFSDSYSSFYSLPLCNGATIYGEGQNNTVFYYTPTFVNYAAQIMSSTNQYSSDSTYVSEMVENVVVKDVTFKSDGGFGSVYLKNAKNVLFENVTFIGNGNLVTITADGGDFISENIRFVNCRFVGGNNQIYIEKNSRNILVEGCKFESPNNLFVKIGDNNTTIANLYKIIFNNNFFTGLESGVYTNYVAGQATYVSFTNSRFDSAIAEYQENKPRPFNVDFDYSGKNYTDTLDPTTDVRKVLRFKFTQPKWDYINQLIDPNGILSLNVRRGQALEQSENVFVDVNVSNAKVDISLQGQPDGTELDIINGKGSISVQADENLSLTATDSTSLTTSDLTVSTNEATVNVNDGNYHVNVSDNYTLTAEETFINSPVNFNGTLNLNDSNIVNNGNDNINFVTDNGQLLTVTDISPSPAYNSYAERAIENDNALVTTEMLQKYQSTIHGFATAQNITPMGNVFLYDCSYYHSDNLILKTINVNYINPPEYVCVNEDKGFPYINSYTYPKNTILYLNGRQYIATETFTATIDTDVYSDTMSCYLKSQQPFYDNAGNVITNSVFSYEEKTLYNGHVIYRLMIASSQENARREPINDYELNGHTYTCFSDGVDGSTNLIYIMDISSVSASASDKLSVIYETVLASDTPIVLFNAAKYIDTFDIVLVNNDENPSYYVLGRVEEFDGTYSLSCHTSDNGVRYGRVQTYEPDNQYGIGDIVMYQGWNYKCLNDDMYEDISMTGYKLIQKSTDMYMYVYRGSDGGIYFNEMDTTFENYPVYNQDGTIATDEDRDDYQRELRNESLEDIFDGTSANFEVESDPSKDYVYRNEFYKTPEEKFVRILNGDKFQLLLSKGMGFEFTGSTGVFKTSGEKTSNVLSKEVLEELNLKNCSLAVRFFNKNGEHLAEFSNSDPLENLRIGFFIEGIR